ncbi:MAG: hypothetical protein IH855_01210 [Bacteroidetes bacterium]|nr:hypothetical protein [Bacteroidota bacterium]
MQVLLDHLSAIIIGAAVLLILAATQMHAQRANIEQTASYATKTKALSFGEWIENDILSLGENFGRNRFRFETPVSDTLGNTIYFAFFSDSINVSTGDTLRLMTRYQLENVGVVERGEITTPVFQLHRELAESPVTNGTAPPPSTWTSAWPLSSMVCSSFSAASSCCANSRSSSIVTR